MDTLPGFRTPPIAGLAFRHYQGEQDLPQMLDVLQSSERADQEDVSETLGDFINQYRHLTNCDPYQDVLIAEVNDQMVAHGRVSWQEVAASGSDSGERLYFLNWYMRPEWRGLGLEKTFLCQCQERLRQIIRQQGDGATNHGSRLFQAHATNFQPDKARLLEEDGFQAIRWACKMTCSDLQNIPEAPMPEGLEVRPVAPEHYRQVWNADIEAFQDHWGFIRPSEEDYAGWQQSSQFQPDLWQVAWDHDQVAGMVLNYITQDPADAAAPRIAWTEDICVRRPWRRRGLARALLARSMRMFREMGFTQTSLGVDLNNLHGAHQLYESMGYQIVRLFTIYRKPVV